MFFDLGFLGSAVYLGGVAIVLWRTFRMRLEDPSHEAIIKASLLLVLLHVWSNNPFAAPAALLAWGYAAFAFPLATALSPDAASVPTPQGLPSISGAAPRFSSNDGLLPEEMTL
jgi:hypothetical protein